MATKLYSRQGGNLQGIGIQQPLQPDTTKAKILADVSSTIKSMADANYELGKSELINSVIDNAYQIAPDNLDKFDELIKSNLEKSTADIPNKWREDVLLGAKPKVDAIRSKVIDNVNAKINQEYVDNIKATGDRAFAEQLDANNMLMRAIINEDKEALDIARQYDSSTKNTLYKISGAKDYKGSYIIGDASLRSMLETGQFNKLDAAKYAIDQMSLEELKSFDQRTFQDKSAFMDAYGVNDKTYVDIEKHITSRLKALGDEEKRIITAQTQYNAARLMVSFNEDELDALDDSALPDDFKSKLKDIVDDYEDANVNRAFVDDGFLSAVKAMEPIFMDSGNVNDPEHNKKLLESGLNVLGYVNKVGSATGMDDDEKAELQRALYEGIVSQEFSDAMKPLYSDCKLNDILNTYGWVTGDMIIGEQFLRKIKEQKDPFYLQHDDDIIEALKAQASTVIKEAFAYAAIGDIESAQKRLQAGNEELIKTSYSKIIPAWEFDRMERELRHGKKPIINILGMTLEFQGYDAHDVLVKTSI